MNTIKNNQLINGEVDASMALLKYISDEIIANPCILSLFGHLIKSNKQVHDFQYILINDYLQIKGIDNGLPHVRNVIFETDDAVPFEEATNLFNAENEAIRSEMYMMLVIISRIDGFFDKDEGAFFDRFYHLCGDYSRYDNRSIRQASRLRKLLKKENSKYRSGRRSNSNDNLFRISQKEYLNTVKECRRIATEDFQMIKPICEDTISSAEALISRINSMTESLSDSSAEQDMSVVLTAFAKKISEVILPAAKAYKLKLNQKEAAVEDFTIVLVGRTKAGKSTLKAVLTGSGKDEIGKGKQRTTLVNYIYEWNNLRIIDTPGIDAGGDVEQVDKDIAEMALSEADVVCYLTPCDGVPKKTIEFIDEIVKSNKPVLVLLNYKQNIRDEDDLEDFLDEPDEWRSDKGNNSIMGYYAPIRKAAETNGYDKMVTCYPVFLLAALMADESKYADCSSVLRNASGIDEFLASLKIIVVEQGTFLRSKTIIDDSIGHCTAWLKDFRLSQDNIINQLDHMQRSQEETFRKIDKAQQRFIDNATKAIRQEFKLLATQQAKRFAEAHYAQKKGLDEAWRNYCAQSGFERKIKDAIQIELADFTKVLCDIFEDLAVDMGEAMRSTSPTMKAPLRFDLFPAREVTRFVGSALGIAGTIVLIVANTNPIGWVLTAASIVVSIAANFFKKRADREKAAQDKLYKKLKEEIEKQCEKAVADFSKNARKETGAIVEKAKKVYTDLQWCMESIVTESNVMCDQWEEQIAQMNYHFAKRVLQYLVPGNQPEISMVDRSFGESLDIYVADDFWCDTAKLEGLIKDKVSVINDAGADFDKLIKRNFNNQGFIA